MNLLKTTSNTIAVQEDLQKRLNHLKSSSNYSEIAKLLSYALENVPSEINHQIFDYIPHLFREIELQDAFDNIDSSQIYINEPVVYKIRFPKGQTMNKISYFYIFCYLKEASPLNVCFQGELNKNKPLVQNQYTLTSKKILFEGITSAFTEPESLICVSDPGHFIPGLASSFYIGSKTVNLPQIISSVIENICNVAEIKLKDIFLFGSSAGAMGALLSSTYFSSKVHVLSINAQIITHNLSKIMKVLLKTDDRKTIIKKFGDRVSCLHRFQQDISSVPNIYLLSNINYKLYGRNYRFFQIYQSNFVSDGAGNQSVFDSYAGTSGHAFPNEVLLKKKIEIARTTLMMKFNQGNSSLSISTKSAKSRVKPKTEYFDAYISLGDNCEAGIQFQRIGYEESSFFRFTSSKFQTTFNIIENDFKQIFNREYIVPRPKCKRMILNTKYNIAFHSKLTSTIDSQGQYFSRQYDFDKVFKAETSKINYLIDKWNKMMDSERKVLFILKNDSSERYLDENKVGKIARLLLNKYKNHNFKILCIQLDKFQETQWQNPYLINRYFPFFAPRTSAMHGTSPIDSWDKIFTEFPINEQSKYKLTLAQVEKEALSLKSQPVQKHLSLGKISSDNSAIVGKQGWFFISSGTNQVTEYHVGIKRLPLSKVLQWEQLLHTRIEWHSQRKINYQHIFIPNKIAVYPEYYPEKLNILGKRPVLQLQQRFGCSFIYPLQLFYQYKDKYQLYEKQDSHWNFWGCYLAYQSICQKLGITPNDTLINFPLEVIETKGDLGGKFGRTETKVRKKIEINARSVYDNQVVRYCNQGSIRILKNNTITNGKIIIFGDSFSNPKHLDDLEQQRFGRLATLFAETLNEVHFVWTPWIDYDYIEREKPDFVLTEMAERFLIRVPDDRDHLPLEEFAAMRLEKYKSRTK